MEYWCVYGVGSSWESQMCAQLVAIWEELCEFLVLLWFYLLALVEKSSSFAAFLCVCLLSVLKGLSNLESPLGNKINDAF